MTQFSPILTDREPIVLPEESFLAEGYITLSARIARTGIQTYYGHELRLAGGEAEPERLYRPEDQVFELLERHVIAHGGATLALHDYAWKPLFQLDELQAGEELVSSTRVG